MEESSSVKTPGSDSIVHQPDSEDILGIDGRGGGGGGDELWIERSIANIRA